MNDDPLMRVALASCFPTGTQVIEARSYRHHYLPYPKRVTLMSPAGTLSHCVVKIGDSPDRVVREVQVLHALAEVGLPVPRVLAGPLDLPGPDGDRACSVLSELEGQPLPWVGLKTLAEADMTCRLLIEGVAGLHQQTAPMLRHPVATVLPRITLEDELKEIITDGQEWLQVDVFARAVRLLERAIPKFTCPLVFSNGDYNPLNFLHEGESLTGYVDFESTCFEDPHIGFVKFLAWSQDDYGWGAGKKSGLVERYLYARNLSRAEFAPRLVLRCLRHLLEESLMPGVENSALREHLLYLVEEGTETMNCI